MKSKLLYFFFLVFCFYNCETPSTQTSASYLRLSGKTMGTTYNITYDGRVNHQKAIDSLLQVINNEVSTYIPTSTISKFNQPITEFSLDSAFAKEHFIPNYKTAREVYVLSEGAFDPTVMPLVNYWGFGYTPKKKVTLVDSIEIARRLALIGMDKTDLEGSLLTKTAPAIQLDFSALAKGYAADEIGELLENKGVENSLIEIGGDGKAKGLNGQGKLWNLAISTPEEQALISDYFAAIRIDDQAIATSGNYRNYYEMDGVKYFHTINPVTGFPERNSLLSASVIAETSILADALATTCMVMGLEKSKILIQQLPNTEAYFIYGASDGSMKVWMTEGVEEMVSEFKKRK